MSSFEYSQHYVCIHAHFYQPPRENPWLEDLELESSAYPFHDWNERINFECYHPNAFARILKNGKIVDIVNNYERISFNFGPTLLSWMEKNDPDAYAAIIEADKKSRDHYSGHGTAIAQCYNHMIMPLANRQDKETQIKWGIEDFIYRFQRRPEGMWLPETAVDYETLEVLAEHNILFTILAPNQAKAIRDIGAPDWHFLEHNGIDPKEPYLCKLPSGKKIALFFYDGPVSQGIAFEGTLKDGKTFAQKLMNCIVPKEFTPEQLMAKGTVHPQLIHIATDGETYGHHHKFGDMALAYCINHIEENKLAKFTIYGEYLERFPPRKEVQIHENSSWSCVHGVGRWKENCGCNTGGGQGWHQEWRGPLREAFNNLRDDLSCLYQEESKELLLDPWAARNDYIQVLMHQDAQSKEAFLTKHAKRPLSETEAIQIIRLCEIQRFAMFMFTSCAWFFDEVSGLEPTQNLKYAARAIQLASSFNEIPLEYRLLEDLEKAPSNIEEFEHGRKIYERFVLPSILSLSKVAGHYAILGLIEEEYRSINLFSYQIKALSVNRYEHNGSVLLVGTVDIQCERTQEQERFAIASLYKDHNKMIAKVGQESQVTDFSFFKRNLKESFIASNLKMCDEQICNYFESELITPNHLFKDAQNRVLFDQVDKSLKNIDQALTTIRAQDIGVLKSIRRFNAAVPAFVDNTLAVLLNRSLMECLSQETVDFEQLTALVQEVNYLRIEIDRVSIAFMVRIKIKGWMQELEKDISQINMIKNLVDLLRITQGLNLDINLWRAENIFIRLAKKYYASYREQSSRLSEQWCSTFENLGQRLHVDERFYEQGVLAS